MRIRFLDSVVKGNEIFRLDAPFGCELAAMEIGYVDRWERNRSEAWNTYQASLETRGDKVTNFILHAESQSGISASRKRLLEKSYWENEEAKFLVVNKEIADHGLHEATVDSDLHFFGWAKLSDATKFSELDALLSTDRYFLVSSAEDSTEILDQICKVGWAGKMKRSMQLPTEICEALCKFKIISAIPLGRFDDPDFAVIAIAAPKLAFELYEEVRNKTVGDGAFRAEN